MQKQKTKQAIMHLMEKISPMKFNRWLQRLTENACKNNNETVIQQSDGLYAAWTGLKMHACLLVNKQPHSSDGVTTYSLLLFSKSSCILCLFKGATFFLSTPTLFNTEITLYITSHYHFRNGLRTQGYIQTLTN